MKKENNRPKLSRDWKGRKVRLLRDLETKGGQIFPAGTEMVVRRKFGGLELEYLEACEKCRMRYRHFIKRVSVYDVVLI